MPIDEVTGYQDYIGTEFIHFLDEFRNTVYRHMPTSHMNIRYDANAEFWALIFGRFEYMFANSQLFWLNKKAVNQTTNG